MYGFSSDAVLREQYRDPWNSIRIGMLLEDLDSLAGSIALKVNSNLVSELVTPKLFQSWAFEKLCTISPWHWICETHLNV
jgi:acyl-coenzyme A thioesterase 9